MKVATRLRMCGASSVVAVPQFLTDTFTGTDGTTLVSHTPELGGAWTKHTAATAGEHLIASNRLRTSVVTGAHWSAATPPSADYRVTAFFVPLTYVSGMISPTVGGRSSTSALSYYGMRWVADADTTGNGHWDLIKRVSGTVTILQSSATESVGSLLSTRVAVLAMTGTALSVTVDGVLKCSGTDATFATASKVVIATGTVSAGTTGIHIDSLSAA